MCQLPTTRETQPLKVVTDAKHNKLSRNLEEARKLAKFKRLILTRSEAPLFVRQPELEIRANCLRYGFKRGSSIYRATLVLCYYYGTAIDRTTFNHHTMYIQCYRCSYTHYTSTTHYATSTNCTSIVPILCTFYHHTMHYVCTCIYLAHIPTISLLVCTE